MLTALLYCTIGSCVLVILVLLSVLAKWLVRKTSLRTPICNEEITSTQPRSERLFLCISLVYCLFIYITVCFPSSSTQYIFYMPVAWYSLFMLQVPLNTNLLIKLTFIQWLKWFCEAGAHLTKPGWNRPDIRSTPTNLALFWHKITLYRFNQGGSYYSRGAQIGARGLSPPSPLTLTTAFIFD